MRRTRSQRARSPRRARCPVSAESRLRRETQAHDAADPAEVRRILRLAIPSPGRLWAAIGFGFLSGGSAVALLGVSAWLITRASEQPALMYLSAAVVGVRAFALGRAFFRYLERLAGHDAAFRQLGTVRSRLYARLEPLAPDGLRGVRS